MKLDRHRRRIAQPPNGRVKTVLGLRQFSLRGLHRVQAEWRLVCMALNLRRMAVLGAGWPRGLWRESPTPHQGSAQAAIGPRGASPSAAPTAARTAAVSLQCSGEL